MFGKGKKVDATVETTPMAAEQLADGSVKLTSTLNIRTAKPVDMLLFAKGVKVQRFRMEAAPGASSKYVVNGKDPSGELLLGFRNVKGLQNITVEVVGDPANLKISWSFEAWPPNVASAASA